MKRIQLILMLSAICLTLPKSFSQDNQSGDNNNHDADWAWMTLRGGLKDKELRKSFKVMKRSGIDGLLILQPGIPNENFPGIAALAKKEGLSVHIWIPVTNPHGGKDLQSEHPEWFQVSREGKSTLEAPPYVSYYKWLCPNNPGAHDYLVGLMQSLAKLDYLDGVHLDYIRFPDVILPVGIQPKYDLVQDKEYPEFDFCYCEHCRKKFQSQTGIDPMDFEDPANNREWVQFRYNSITELVNNIYEVVHPEGKMLSAAVFPTPQLAKQLVRQDWANWKIDALMPMIYHEYYYEPLSWIETATREGVEGLNGRIPLYSGVFVGWIEAEEMDDMVSYSEKAGADGICLFNSNMMTKKQWKELGKALNNK